MLPKSRGLNALRPKKLSIHPKNLLKEWKLFQGDTVQIVEGPEAGKQGKIIEIVKPLNSVVVEDCNKRIKHLKPTALLPKGGRIQKEMPIPHDKVALLDPIAKVPTPVSMVWEFDPTRGHRALQRRTEATGTLVPIPLRENPFKTKPEGPLDTKPDVVSKVTWTPNVLECPFPAPFMNELERMRRKNREGQAL